MVPPEDHAPAPDSPRRHPPAPPNPLGGNCQSVGGADNGADDRRLRKGGAVGPPSRQPPASGFESPGASPGWSPGHPGVRSPNAGTRSPTRILGPHRCRPLCGKGVPPPSRGPPPAGVAARGHLGPRGGGPVRDSIPGSGSRPPEPRAAPGVPAQARRRLPANGTRAGLRCRLRPRAGRGSGGPAGGGGEARPRASPPAA